MLSTNIFKDKFLFPNLSKKELKYKLFLFKILKNKLLVNVSIKFIAIFIFLKIPFIKYIIKELFFRHFIGGEKLKDCLKLQNNLTKFKINLILDYGIENTKSRNKINKNYNKLLETILFSRDNKIPFIAIKLTSIATFDLLIKASKNDIEVLESDEYLKLITRVNTLCKLASDGNIKILIDAEESWIQPSIDTIAFRMMLTYNKNEAIVYNTIQFYLKEKVKFLKHQIELSKEHKIIYGVKIVRGAYLEKENKRALKFEYSSPINNSKKITDLDFNNALEISLNNLNNINIIIATHNLESILYCLNKMKKLNLKNNSNKIYFSQLLGMYDRISFGLSDLNYNVLKYVPYGPLNDLIPYLTRRLQENSSIQEQLDEEIQTIKNALILKK